MPSPRSIDWVLIGSISAYLLVGGVAPLVAAEMRADTFEAMRREWHTLETEVYDAVERAPIRHWADAAQRFLYVDPFRNAENALRGEREPLSETAQEVIRSLPGAVDEAYREILGTLLLAPAGTVSVNDDGELQVSPRKPEAVVYRRVPTALILRIMPFGTAGKLAIRPSSGEGIAIEAQDLDATEHFVRYAVLPLRADAAVGTHSAALEITGDGKRISVPLAVDVRPSGSLRGTVARRGDDAPLAAKLFVEDEQGRLYVVPGERNYRTQSWYAFFQPRFSYVEKEFSIPLPPGTYRVTAMKGYAHRNWEGTVEIRADEVSECEMAMEQLRALEEGGWHCADMHVHGHTTLPMLRAEDVNVAAHCHYASDRPRALPVYEDESDEQHRSCSAQEIEHWNFGNAFYFGVPTTVQDPATLEPEMTPFFHYDEQCHKMGGVSLRWLRARPFSPEGGGQQQPEIAVDAALGYMDVWSVMDNSMQNLLDSPTAQWSGDGWHGAPLYDHTYDTWYALLKCGIRIPASAGTSYGRLSRLGFNRVYARCPGQLSVREFAAALKRGDGFVTNGPLLWLRANGSLPGEGVALDAPAEVEVAIELACRHPIELVQLLRNGDVVAERRLEDFDGQFAWEHTLNVEEPCWIAAQCYGRYTPHYPHSASRNHFAHTNPLFITVAGEKPRSPRDAARFVQEIDALIGFVPNIPTEPLRSRSLAVFRRARDYFAEMANN